MLHRAGSADGRVKNAACALPSLSYSLSRIPKSRNPTDHAKTALACAAAIVVSDYVSLARSALAPNRYPSHELECGTQGAFRGDLLQSGIA